MAETIDNLSGEEREQRIAELKARMQASAQTRQAEESAQEDAEAASGDATATATAEADAVESEEADAPVAEEPANAATTDAETAEATEATDTAETTETAETVETNPTATNGTAATATNGAGAAAVPQGAAPTVPAIEGRIDEDEDPEALQRRQYNRREFMTYAWGLATVFTLAQTGYLVYEFMYPRFRAGEFGGKFFVDTNSVPSPEDAPQPYTDGKFWLVRTEEGDPKALYMVCPHLGCLYKWEPANWRFECPCHGSKYTHDGYYIEGPAPRSLDYFDIAEEGNELAINTGRKTLGIPAAESPARAAPA